MKSWIDTVGSLFLGRWWWFPSVFFGPWWLSLLLVCMTALTLWVSTSTAGSNGPLLVALALTGVSVGSWTRRLHRWDCAVLVPDLPRRLFVLPLVIVTAVAFAFAAFSLYAGNPVPALGPALLAGVGVVYCLVRLGEWFGPLLIALGPWLLLVWAVGGPPPYLEVLSHPAAQVPALAFALALLAALKRRLTRPVAASAPSAPSALLYPMSAGGFRGTSGIAKRTFRVALAGVAVETLIHLSSGHPYLGFLEGGPGSAFAYDGLVFTSALIIICPAAFLNPDDFPAAWLLGIGGTRSRVGRSLVSRTILAGSLPLLGFFMATETVWSRLREEAPRFDLLLESQILAFLALGCAYAFRRTYPNRFLTHAPIPVAILLWGFGPLLMSPFDFGLPVLVLLAAGSAVAAVYAVGHGLARARYLL